MPDEILPKPMLTDAKELEVFSKHYTDLFIYQARQRLDSIRYFFVAFAVFVSAIGSSNFNSVTKSLLSFAGGFLSLAFLRLDFRNAQIVEIDEKPLKDLQAFFKNRAGAGHNWQTFARCDAERRNFTTYSQIVPFVYSMAWISCFAIGLYYLSSSEIDFGCNKFAFFLGLSVLLIAVGLVATLKRPVVDYEADPGDAASTTEIDLERRG